VQAVIRLYRGTPAQVFRTAALYVLGAWAALQVAADVSGVRHPRCSHSCADLTAVLGLPVAVVFGWLFEIGPGRIRRTHR
jgi:hypothetical protein